jgi:hypothetical protein
VGIPQINLEKRAQEEYAYGLSMAEQTEMVNAKYD